MNPAENTKTYEKKTKAATTLVFDLLDVFIKIIDPKKDVNNDNFKYMFNFRLTPDSEHIVYVIGNIFKATQVLRQL